MNLCSTGIVRRMQIISSMIASLLPLSGCETAIIGSDRIAVVAPESLKAPPPLQPSQEHTRQTPTSETKTIRDTEQMRRIDQVWSPLRFEDDCWEMSLAGE